jgi:hypothetical protein
MELEARVAVANDEHQGEYRQMLKMPKMPKMTVKLAGELLASGIGAFFAAVALSYVAQNHYQLSAEAIRGGALNAASLVVAYLLVAGINFRQKDKK